MPPTQNKREGFEATMSDEELRIKVSELRGDSISPTAKPTIEELEALLNSEEKLRVTIMPNGEVRAIRDYPADLNAMHEAEETKGMGTMGNSLHDKFEIELAEICYQEGVRRSIFHATARQRAEAFVLALGLKSKQVTSEAVATGVSSKDAGQANTLPKEDTERMDWLERNAFQRADEDSCRHSIHVGLLGKTFETGNTLREAIDAAMAVTSEREGGEAK